MCSSGKTSIARVLAGLWPVFEGIVRRPGKGEIFFLPQRRRGFTLLRIFVR